MAFSFLNKFRGKKDNEEDLRAGKEVEKPWKGWQVDGLNELGAKVGTALPGKDSSRTRGVNYSNLSDGPEEKKSSSTHKALGTLKVKASSTKKLSADEMSQMSKDQLLAKIVTDAAEAKPQNQKEDEAFITDMKPLFFYALLKKATIQELITAFNVKEEHDAHVNKGSAPAFQYIYFKKIMIEMCYQTTNPAFKSGKDVKELKLNEQQKKEYIEKENLKAEQLAIFENVKKEWEHMTQPSTRPRAHTRKTLPVTSSSTSLTSQPSSTVSSQHLSLEEFLTGGAQKSNIAEVGGSTPRARR